MKYKTVRSANMAAIRSRDTAPELIVRRLAHRLGLRFRLHQSSLPGKPDLVFPRHRKVVFVHGCFWHQHSCPDGHLPKSRISYWTPKLRRNCERDAEQLKLLKSLGWDVLIIWECQTKASLLGSLEKELRAFLID